MNDNLNRALAPTAPNSLQITDAGLRDFAGKLKLLLPNGAKLTENEALAGAQYAKTTGLDPFRGEFYIVPGIGVVPGYKGALTRDGQLGRNPDYRYRPLTEEEKEWHDVQPGDKAVICFATDPAEAAQARKEGREPRIWEGVGIVRKADMWVSEEWRTNQQGKNFKAKIPEAQWKERKDPPQGRSWGWVAQKTALKDCNNHMGIPVEMDAAQIISSAQAAGIPVEAPEGAWLDSDQAGALVAEALQEHARRASPPSEAAQRSAFDRNVRTMRGDPDDDPFADAPPPPDADFDSIPSATEDRKQAPAPQPNGTPKPVTCPKCGGPMWDNREGKKNPKAPDYKCKDKTCDGAIWPPKDPADLRKRMWALAKDVYGDHAEAEFKPWVYGRFNVTSSKDLTDEQVSEAISVLETLIKEGQIA